MKAGNNGELGLFVMLLVVEGSINVLDSVLMGNLVILVVLVTHQKQIYVTLR